jgi:hypothetical protein
MITMGYKPVEFNARTGELRGFSPYWRIQWSSLRSPWTKM